MLVTTLSPEADAGELDVGLAASRRNTAACSPEANADLPTLSEAFPLLRPADGDLPDVINTLRLRRRVSPEADADLAPSPRLGQIVLPRHRSYLHTHLADPTYRAVLEPVWIR